VDESGGKNSCWVVCRALADPVSNFNILVASRATDKSTCCPFQRHPLHADGVSLWRQLLDLVPAYILLLRLK